MSRQPENGKVPYYRLHIDDKPKISFEGDESCFKRCLTTVNSMCAWPICAALLLLLWVAWFTVWLSTHALLMSAIGANLTLVRIPTKSADKMAAYCLDGSEPAYYFRRGRNNKWIVHFPSSDLCFTLKQCEQLARTVSGSSRSLPPSIPGDGILSPDRDVNPDFYDWNMVSLHSCDGGLYTGDVYAESPSVYNEVYLRGSHILECVTQWLHEGIQNADEVIVAGTGTGAQAVYLHLDAIVSNLPSTIRVTGLADSGLFLDVRNMTNFPQTRKAMQHIYLTHKAKDSLDKDCTGAKSPKLNEWQCLIPEVAYRYVSTPLFVVDSFYNPWSIWFSLDLRCYPPSCKDQVPVLTSHAIERQAKIQSVIKSDHVTNGLYLTSCFENDFVLSNRTWNGVFTMGTVLREAFHTWYTGSTDHSNYTDCYQYYRCNALCDWSPRHYLETVDAFKTQPEFFIDKQ